MEKKKNVWDAFEEGVERALETFKRVFSGEDPNKVVAEEASTLMENLEEENEKTEKEE